MRLLPLPNIFGKRFSVRQLDELEPDFIFGEVRVPTSNRSESHSLDLIGHGTRAFETFVRRHPPQTIKLDGSGIR